MPKQTKLFGDEEVQVRKTIPLEEAKTIADNLLALNKSLCEKIDIVGAIRRRRPTVNDIDFVVVANDKNWEDLKKNMAVDLNAKKVLSGPKISRSVIPYEDGGIQIDIYRAVMDTYGVLKLIRTGSEEHNICLAKYAIQQGLRLLYSKGICEGDFVIASTDEVECFHALNLEFIPPELREIGSNGKPVWEWSKYYRGG